MPEKIPEEKAKKTVNESGETDEDQNLIRESQKGDKESFGQLVAKYQRRLMRYIILILGRRDPTEDVVQEAFVKAWLALNSFDLTKPFYPWLATIARNLALNRIKKEDKEKPASEFEGLLESRPDGAADPLNQLLNRESSKRLAQAVAELPPQFREVFVLRMIENLSYDEIARRLNISVGTVDSRLFRAREKLVQMLKDLL